MFSVDRISLSVHVKKKKHAAFSGHELLKSGILQRQELVYVQVHHQSIFSLKIYDTGLFEQFYVLCGWNAIYSSRLILDFCQFIIFT